MELKHEKRSTNLLLELVNAFVCKSFNLKDSKSAHDRIQTRINRFYMISFRIYDNVKLIITIPATLNQLKGRFVQALPTTNQPDHVITQLTLAQ
jgi:hypothetical protein